jgi:hypothetical protein
MDFSCLIVLDVVHFRQPGSGVQTGLVKSLPALTRSPCSATILAAGATDFILPIILITKELTDLRQSRI